MKGDFTRSTFRPQEQYSSVRLQQGRVQVDADWNEQVDIQNHADETTRLDVIGRCGVPEDNPGFGVSPVGTGLEISAGRLYLDGILVENPTDVSFVGQPFAPGAELPTDAGVYWAYIDVWRRHLTALEVPEIREIALGDPDTATRVQTVWRVGLEMVDPQDAVDLNCDDFPNDWTPAERPPSTGALAAKAEAAASPEGDCIVPALAGYRGLENQLYRVEIHKPGPAGTATFKWSRDNATMVSRWLSVSGNSVEVADLGRDAVLGFASGQWVELTDEPRQLAGNPGLLREVIGIDGRFLELAGAAPNFGNFDADTAVVRRWDGTTTVPTDIDEWVDLERGVQVNFGSQVAPTAAHFNTGDYWTIPARTLIHDLLWDQDGSGDPVSMPPEGVAHHYCNLAIVKLTISNNTPEWELLHDCRDFFPPLTDLDAGCCVHVGTDESLQAAIDELVAAGGGCICLEHGVHVIEHMIEIKDATDLTIHGAAPNTALHFVGKSDAAIRVSASHRLRFSRLFLMAEQTTSVISLDDASADIGFDDVCVFNANLISVEALDERKIGNAAIRVNVAALVRLTNCQLVADVGLLVLPTQKLKTPTEVGPSEVLNLVEASYEMRVENTQFSARQFGVWGLKADRWHIDKCIFSGRGPSPGPSDALAVLSPGLSPEEAFAEIRLGLSLLMLSQATDAQPIRVYAAEHLEIARCAITGARGVEVSWSRNLVLRENTVRAKNGAVTLTGCSRAKVVDNTLSSASGPAFNWLWSKDTVFRGNRLRGDAGIVSTTPADAKERLSDFAKTLESVYQISHEVARWVLHEGIFQLFELQEWLKAAAPFYSSTDLPPGFGVANDSGANLFDMFIWSATQLALAVIQNDVVVNADALLMEEVVLLGATVVRDNRCHSETARAIVIQLQELVADLQSFADVLRMLSGTLSESDLGNNSVDVEAIGDAIRPVLEKLQPYLHPSLSVSDNHTVSPDVGIFSNAGAVHVSNNRVSLSGNQPETKSAGIVLHGAGVEVTGNCVRSDAGLADQTATSGNVGGISLKLELNTSTLMSWLPIALDAAAGSAVQPELMFQKPSVVAHNIVGGGFGFGISVEGSHLTGTRISDNHISNLGGGGIVVSRCVDVDVNNNRIDACVREASMLSGGSDTTTAAADPLQVYLGLTDGLHILNSVLVRVSDNTIERCGIDQESVDVIGVHLRNVVGLTLTNNVIRDNGTLNPRTQTGGCGLREVYGQILIHSNTIDYNRGSSLEWANESLKPDNPVIVQLSAAMAIYLNRPADLTNAVAVLSNNRINVLPELLLADAPVRISLVPSLEFIDNHIEAVDGQVELVNCVLANSLVVNGNRLTTTHDGHAFFASVGVKVWALGNICPKDGDLRFFLYPIVNAANNFPPVP